MHTGLREFNEETGLVLSEESLARVASGIREEIVLWMNNARMLIYYYNATRDVDLTRELNKFEAKVTCEMTSLHWVKISSLTECVREDKPIELPEINKSLGLRMIALMSMKRLIDRKLFPFGPHPRGLE